MRSGNHFPSIVKALKRVHLLVDFFEIPFTRTITVSFQLLHSTFHVCPRYNQLMKSEAAEIADSMLQKYADVVDVLANVTGIGGGLKFGRIAALTDIQREA